MKVSSNDVFCFLLTIISSVGTSALSATAVSVENASVNSGVSRFKHRRTNENTARGASSTHVTQNLVGERLRAAQDELAALRKKVDALTAEQEKGRLVLYKAECEIAKLSTSTAVNLQAVISQLEQRYECSM